MRKYIIIGLIFVLCIIAILAIPSKVTAPSIKVTENVTLPIPPTTVTPNGNIPQPPVTVAPKKEFINNATEYYLGNWGKTDKSRLENLSK
jgi:hypothetical protein